MPRDIVLGNGDLLVCLDRNLYVRDLYWPHVGLFNHLSGRKVRFGVWAEGAGFAWTDAPEWDRDLSYRANSLVGESHLRHDGLGVSLTVLDAVDHRRALYLRRVLVRNLWAGGAPREVRLFWAPDTILAETDIGDTAYYDAFAGAVIHYKWTNYLLFGGSGPADTRPGLFGYACGMKGLEGMEGTWRDCEDGWLSGNAIAQGSVDSALAVSAGRVAPLEEGIADLWMCAGCDRDAVLGLQATLLAEGGPAAALEKTERYWRAWVQRGQAPSTPMPTAAAEARLSLLPPRVQEMYRRSLLLIRTQTDNRGAILAANDTDIMKENRAHYSYMWPRDGALVAHALDGAGYSLLTRRFFEFCRRVLPKDRAALMHKYAPDGSWGSSWHSYLAPDGTPEMPLQEDETALPVWALWHHYERHRDFEFVEGMYGTFTRPCADFLLDYRDARTGLPLPSWDLWEERRGVHTYTVCAVIAALEAAARFAALFGDLAGEGRYRDGAASVRAAMLEHLYAPEHRRFARRLVDNPDHSTWLDMTQDASLHALHLFDALPHDDPRVMETLRQVDERLWVKAGIGGMARYEGDYYGRISDDLWNVPGNPWIICTLWRAQWQIARARTLKDLEAPRDLLEWVNLTALPSGVLPEQIHPYDFTPITVAPLTWSHSEVVETVLRWLRKHAELSV